MYKKTDSRSTDIRSEVSVLNSLDTKYYEIHLTTPNP